MSTYLNLAGLQLIMLVMLAFATVAFTLMTIVTVSNAWRLRNPMLAWRSGKIYGFPLFATIFLAFTITTSVILMDSEQQSIIPMMLCYNWIAMMWWLTSYQLSKRYITDYGIVKNVNDPSQTVAWSNVNDYIETKSKGGSVFIFMYLMPVDEFNRKKMVRLELFVPSEHTSIFKKLLDYKLRRRFVEAPETVNGFATTS
jgi:hypothetical protein